MIDYIGLFEEREYSDEYRNYIEYIEDDQKTVNELIYMMIYR